MFGTMTTSSFGHFMNITILWRLNRLWIWYEFFFLTFKYCHLPFSSILKKVETCFKFFDVCCLFYVLYVSLFSVSVSRKSVCLFSPKDDRESDFTGSRIPFRWSIEPISKSIPVPFWIDKLIGLTYLIKSAVIIVLQPALILKKHNMWISNTVSKDDNLLLQSKWIYFLMNFLEKAVLLTIQNVRFRY